ncbi:MAG: TolC family protein [Pyrinomonadaceae bacterium]|nr:TolC family protein [Pyrinomonadaceae bacterium]
MKRFFSASLLLVLSVLAATAQITTTTNTAPTVTPTVAPTPTPAQRQTTLTNPIDNAKPLTISDAVDLALKQASLFRSSQINEQIAAQDVQMAKAALYPRAAANPTLIYTSPSLSNSTMTGITPTGNITSVTTRPPSFLGANAITEYQAVINAAGEIDTSGRLRATIKRNQLLLEAARAGTEVARRDLAVAITDAYYNLALATLRRRGSEMNLQTAQEFENNIKLQLDAGEVAPVDLVRARLQTSLRRDELEQARANEAVNADSLRVFIGYDFSAPVATEDLLVQLPQAGEIDNYTQTLVATRPEFAQFEAERLAAEQDVRIAKSERKPQITYSINGGFISDSLRPRPIYNTLGIQPTIGVSIPIFDRGASKAKQTQAQLRIQQAQNNRLLAERQFAQAFFSARTQAQSAALRIRQIGDAITLAEQNVRASLARYQAGEASIVEVTDAQNTLVNQRLALYQAIFDYQTARVRLLRAIGQ